MGFLLKGTETAASLTKQAEGRALELRRRGVKPALAIVRIGEREEDISYERGAVKRCAQAGVEVRLFNLEKGVPQQKLILLIEQLNADANVHGILIMRPLPAHIDDAAVCRVLLPEKDVDGITEGSMAGIYSGREIGFAPCTAQACIAILLHNGIDIEGRRAAVIGRSLVIGKPAAMLLMAANMTVTVCHTKTQNLPSICREADVLIVAAGKAEMLGAESVKEGQVVLDVGIHVGENNRLCGDVKTDEIKDIVRAVTPVPGGVGGVTTSVLALHVVTAAERMSYKEEL